MKAVPVDSGRVMIVDPSNLPIHLVRALTEPNEYGVILAQIFSTNGDGLFPVTASTSSITVDIL